MNKIDLPKSVGALSVPVLNSRRMSTFACAALAAFGSLPYSAVAQEESDEEIFELSPFEVQADEDGWRASETLAGSRMRTSYTDVATQIEALTTDFMDDYSLNNLEEAAMYTVNVEGTDEIVTGNGLPGSQGNIRIRGLANGTNSREFFALRAPGDNYNVDRIEIASGPNSILFGTGSPAGVINGTLKRATTSEDFGDVRLQVSSFGGFRGQLDVNRVLIDDKLAVRFASVYEEKQWEQDYTNEERRRVYATFTYRPWENTTVSVHYEDVNVVSHRPSRNYPTDGITGWYESETLGNGGGYPNQHIFQNDAQWANGLDLNNDGDFTDEGEIRPKQYAEGNQLFENGDNVPVVIGGGYDVPTWGWQDTVDIRSPKDWDHIPSINREADGYTLINDDYYPTNVNTLSNVRWDEDDYEIFNAFFTQKLAENLYFEFGMQQERNNGIFKERVNYIGGVQVKVDPNAYLSDGVTPNPNAGEMYFQGYPAFDESVGKTQDFRAALSYEFDFQDKTDRFAFLGLHRFGALTSGNNSWSQNQVFRYHLQPEMVNGEWRDAHIPGLEYELTEIIPGFNSTPLISSPLETLNGMAVRDDDGNLVYASDSSWLQDGKRRPQNRWYVGNTIVPTADMDPGEDWTIIDGYGEAWTMTPRDWGHVDSNGIPMVQTDGSANSSRDRLRTNQFSYQGFFWKNRVIGTYGYREDRVNNARVVAEQNRDLGLRTNTLLADFAPFNPENADSGITRTKGVIVRPIRDLVKLPFGLDIGFHYNESDTFQPSTSQFTAYGERVPGSLGDGEDKGIMFSAFDGKLTARYNEFVNTAGPARAANTPFNRFRFTLNGSLAQINRVLPSYKSEPGWPESRGGPDSPGVYDRRAGQYWVTSFREAKGKEFSLNWSVNQNLDVRFNWNEQNVVESNIGNPWAEYTDQVEAFMDGITFKENGNNNPQDRNGDGVISDYTWETAPQSNGQWPNADPNNPDAVFTMKDRWMDQVRNGANGIGIIKALEGKSNEFVRQNRFNLNANYRFKDGMMKGVSFGGAVRWREAPLIGYGSAIVNGTEIVDINNPFKGEEELYLDLRYGHRGLKTPFTGDRKFNIQLNVRNALDEDDDIPTLYNALGEPIRYGRITGREFVFSVDFDI
ncbi:TonB-dependent receptor plug domain-containing protein [Pelagicoccus mobilis]|uniref:TonB-dependent receptor plug domain-containing protein n=1 Tax=Pelagicoccus mobilis TaxID=415221 RepID=A0A934RU90_9BACT|nr:TonB-dependent receptor plug domain-containing protein [Pelagicoccus mobilis]MBK1875520.1 hypothetical protein [Pelagicoccus mobilis]